MPHPVMSSLLGALLLAMGIRAIVKERIAWRGELVGRDARAIGIFLVVLGGMLLSSTVFMLILKALR